MNSYIRDTSESNGCGKLMGSHGNHVIYEKPPERMGATLVLTTVFLASLTSGKVLRLLFLQYVL